MSRKPLVLLILLFVATLASARTRSVTPGKHPGLAPNAATVGGIVDSVEGTLIRLADGHVTIETKDAKIVLDRGVQGTIDQIKPGTILFAMISRTDIEPNAPLPASMITVLRVPDATLFGPVQEVDLGNQTLTVLGRTIRVTDATSIGGFHRDGKPDLGDIQPNHIVQVQADVKNGELVASSILVLAPAPPELHAARGEVKSIGAESWVIAPEKGEPLTLKIDANTKIVGSPKVGDTVEVLYTVDSAHALVAISILRFERPEPPAIPDLKRFHGPVKSIDGSKWIVSNDGKDFEFIVNGDTKIEPGIRAGDKVDGLAKRDGDGPWIAVLIMKSRF
jgi:hypothetical protein